MNTQIRIVVATVTLAVPLVSFAQANASLTREQVRKELVQLERAGYNPVAGDWSDYPSNVQAAQARVAVQGEAGRSPAGRQP
jgi:hypothetical protein